MRDADFSVPLSLALLFNVKNQRDLGVSSIGHIPSKQAKERRETGKCTPASTVHLKI